MNSQQLLYRQPSVAASNSESNQKMPCTELKQSLRAIALLGALAFSMFLNTAKAQTPFALPETPGCTKVSNDDASSFMRCSLVAGPQTPKLNLLVLRGDFSETARIHGRLLARQIDSGIMSYVRDTRRHFFENLPENKRKTFASIFKCLLGRLVRSADAEFLAMHSNLAAGLKEGGITGITEADIIEMGFANELGSIVSGLQRTIKRDPTAGYAKLATMCGREIISDLAAGLFLKPDLGSAFMQMGCTGIAVSHDESDNFWMSRNLDGSALGYFDKHPTIIVHDPRPHNQTYHRYIGVAAAGLHYVGGNAGFNDAGIGVTLHEMETEKFRTAHPSKNALTAVYLQNRILERASSIDQAWQIIRDTGVISAWTLIVGDAKTGEVATFEISGRQSVLAERISRGIHAQANKFISPLMQDDFYNYSFNKVLESRFRLQRVAELTKAIPLPLTPQWFINSLSDHVDAYQGLRSFGRNIIKTNTMMTQIFAPGAGTLVTSLGDRYPVGQGSFAQFAVDFSALDRNESPLRFIQILNSENPAFADKHNWRAGLQEYVRAYLVYKAAPDSTKALSKAVDLVEKAQRLALQDAIEEFPYGYILGKLLLKSAALTAAAGDSAVAAAQVRQAHDRFAELIIRAKPSLASLELHPYDRAMLLVWFARTVEVAAKLGATSDPSSELPSKEQAFGAAREMLLPLLQGERQDFELRQFLKSFSTGPEHWRAYSLADAATMRIDFVTVE